MLLFLASTPMDVGPPCRTWLTFVYCAVGDAPIQQKSKGGADDSDDDMDGN